MNHAGTVLACALTVLAAGCATTPLETPLHPGTGPVAWSLRGAEDDMVVRISPAGKTLRLAGSAGTLVGGSVDALVNDRYRQRLADAAGDWDSAGAVASIVTARLAAALGDGLLRVPPPGTTAGSASIREAAQARYHALNRQGLDTLLDLSMSHGLYGPEAQPLVVLDARLVDLREGRVVWHRELMAGTSPVLTTDPLRNPTGRLRPTLADPRLRVDAAAVEALARNGAAPLKREIAAAAEAATAMLLTALQIEESGEGRYHLGRAGLLAKDFAEAVRQFERALELHPGYPEAMNALAVTWARQGNLERAVELGRDLADAVPDFAPAHYNLAWWLAEQGETAEAKAHYKAAQQLGLGMDPQLERRLQ